MLSTVFFLQAHTCPEQQDVLLNVRCLLKVSPDLCARNTEQRGTSPLPSLPSYAAPFPLEHGGHGSYMCLPAAM